MVDVRLGPKNELMLGKTQNTRLKGEGETELRERLNRLQELRILPESRVQPGVNSDGQAETG